MIASTCAISESEDIQLLIKCVCLKNKEMVQDTEHINLQHILETNMRRIRLSYSHAIDLGDLSYSRC